MARTGGWCRRRRSRVRSFGSFGRRHGRLRSPLGARRALDAGRRGRGDERPTAPWRRRARRRTSAREALAAAGAELLAEASSLRPEVARRARPRRSRARLARRRLRRRAHDRREDGARAHRRPRRLRPADGLAPDRGGRRVRLVLLAAAAVGAWLFLRRRRAGDERHVVVGWADGSELELGDGIVAGAPRLDRRGRTAVSAVDELGRRLVDVALLEGDFTLRSGRRSRWYLDKYRFETDPELLRALGERLAAAIRAVGAGHRPHRRAGARSGRAGRLGGDGVRSALHHRAR